MCRKKQYNSDFLLNINSKCNPKLSTNLGLSLKNNLEKLNFSKKNCKFKVVNKQGLYFLNKLNEYHFSNSNSKHSSTVNSIIFENHSPPSISSKVKTFQTEPALIEKRNSTKFMKYQTKAPTSPKNIAEISTGGEEGKVFKKVKPQSLHRISKGKGAVLWGKTDLRVPIVLKMG